MLDAVVLGVGDEEVSVDDVGVEFDAVDGPLEGVPLVWTVPLI